MSAADVLERQGSPEWFAARCGHATASRFADVLATIKSGEAATRRNYRAELVCERLTGLPVEHFQSAEMKFGTENEPYARIAYEATTGNVVEECGFLEHYELLAGASPDGLIGMDGGLEIKVPNTATHLDALLKVSTRTEVSPPPPCDHLTEIDSFGVCSDCGRQVI